MKRLLISGLSVMVVVLFACNDKGTAGNSGNDKHKEMLDANRALLKAIETGDSATLHKYIADDAVDHGGGDKGADVKGMEVLTMLTDAHNHFDNLKFEVLQEAANDDNVFCLTRMTGTVKTPYWGMAAGFKADMKSVDLSTMKNGKVTDHWAFMDPAEMMKMMPPGAMHEGAGNGMDSTKK